METAYRAPGIGTGIGGVKTWTISAARPTIAGHMVLLEQLLRRPLHVVQAGELVLPKGKPPPPELIVDSPRVLLVQGGTLRYTVDGRSFEVKAGEMIFVPALVR